MFYEIAEDPLGDSADPRRYVPVDTHERALEALDAGIRQGRSPVLLMGVGGVGKTLLLRVLAERERRCGYAAIFSPFLHLAPDDVARWLLHLLGRPLPGQAASDAALLAAVRLYAAPAMVVIVDEIQSAPAPSVRRLTELARACGAKFSLVVAGAPGSRLDAVLPVLEPQTTFELPDALLPGELDALCEAILSHPALEPALRELSRRERDALLRAACGIPAMLKNELVRRSVCVAIGTSIPRLASAPESARAADLWREPEPAWPTWPAEPAVDPQPELERDHARWSRSPAIDEMDLAVWPPPRPVTAPHAAAESAAVTRARGRDPMAATGAALRFAIRQRVAAWARATRERVPLMIAALRQAPARAQSTALRLGARLRPLLGHTLARARTIAAEAGAAAAAGADALTAAAAARGGGAAVRSFRVELRRLPRHSLTAAAALLVIAVAPLRDAGRVEIAAVAPVSAGPPAAVGAAFAATSPRTSRDAASLVALPAPSPQIRVQVNARPWARLRVDGVDAGSTPLSHLRLAAGPHDFEARFPDGRVLHRRIEIGPEQRFVSLP